MDFQRRVFIFKLFILLFYSGVISSNNTIYLMTLIPEGLVLSKAWTDSLEEKITLPSVSLKVCSRAYLPKVS